MDFLLHCGIGKTFSCFCKVSKKNRITCHLYLIFLFFLLVFWYFSPLKATGGGERGSSMAFCGNNTKRIATHRPLSFKLLHSMWQLWQ